MKYSVEKNNLLKAIDIAIISFEKYPPKEFSDYHLTQVIQTYLNFKESIFNFESQYQNLSSLKYIKTDVLTYFDESENETTNFFWNEIKKQDLNYTKNDKLSKILKRGKIKSKKEYDFIQDVFVIMQQEKRINESEIKLINHMLSEFEKNINKLN